ncbi:hypothetical protein GUITHDRAFT_149947, partial [Guillardia theta CCMP2712]
PADTVGGNESRDPGGSIDEAAGESASALEEVLLTEELETPLSAWNLWFCGNEKKQIPPLRNVSAGELKPGQSNTKRRSDVKFLVKCFEQHMNNVLADKDADERDTELRRFEELKRGSGVRRMFRESQEIFVKYESSFYSWINVDSGYSFRRGQLKWNTFVKKLRKKFKKNSGSSASSR